MSKIAQLLKYAVTALVFPVGFSLPGVAFAQSDDIDLLFEELRTTDPASVMMIEDEIWMLWSQSGSPAMDLLLERGREAMDQDDFGLAVEHLTALVDHAPDFAEGYHARATAYYREGLYGPALADIMQTLELNPRHFGAMTGLALIFEELGYPDEALAAYREVKAIHPQQRDLDEAIERLERMTGGETL
ncbi:MAG: tetratricopeptide repeat protein [Rhodobacteraceae bacterium]|nr:tetratricopeptide repeat protein [Paracoccaceae bacterium]